MRNIKRYKLLVAALAIQISIGGVGQAFADETDLVPNPEPTPNVLSDIQGHWAESAILNFVQEGYIGGYEDGTFKPNDGITRAEFIKLVNQLFNFKEKGEISFEDVKESNWYYEAVRLAVQEGYVSDGKKFRPNDKITREEISTMITRIMNNKDPKTDKIMNYSDLKSISNWAKTSLEGAIEAGFIGGYEDNTIRPKEVATRAQAVAILSRIIQLQGNKQGGTALIENNNYILQKHEPRQGTYLGSYVFQDNVVNGNMDEFEKLTGKKHASYFFYLGYKKGDLVRYDKWMSDVVKRGGIPQVALEPNQGLYEVYEDTYLIDLAKMFGKYNSPIYLRYASEMNGNWVAYNGNPELYKDKWRVVHDVMEKYAPNVMMVWTPYEKPIGNILDYYPGDGYVDWVGVNAYNVIHRNNDLSKPVNDDPLEMIDYVYDEFSNRKPIQISEFGTAYDTLSDDKDYTDRAIENLERLYNGIWEKYPRIKSIFYFNVNNITSAPEGRNIYNFSLTENKRFLNAYKNIIKSDKFLSNIQPNAQGKTNREIFTLKDNTRIVNGQQYINIDNIISIVGGEYRFQGESVEFTINKKTVTFNNIYKDDYNTYVSINEFGKKMNYKVENRGSADTVILKKI